MNRVQQRSFIATSNLDARSVLVELGSMALLSISAVLPYLVVGKNSSIRGIDWGSRHAIVFSTAVSFCTGLLVQRLSKSLKTIGLQNRIVMIFASMVILAPNASILIYGHFLNISQEHRVTKLISTIKPYSNAFTPGKIAVISDAFRRPLSFYESNYVLYKVTGNLNHYGYVGPKSGMREGLDIPEKLLRRQPAEVYLTTLKSNTMSKCIKIFEVNKGQKVIVKKECI
jgi:hypothetical protein